MSFGVLLAVIVLFLVIVAFVFSAAMPAWLPLVMIGMLALAIILGGVPIRWTPS